MTKDEAANLPQALQSLPAGGAVLVLDAQSTDGTQALAARMGARVIERPWEGFVSARRFALAQVTTSYTLMLDADESLDGELRAAIAAIGERGEDAAGFELRRQTWFAGRPIRGAGWGDERILRLFRTGSVRLEAHPAAGGSAQLHERWVVDGSIRELPGVLRHDSYPSVASYQAKFARYTAIEAAGLQTSPGRVAREAVRALARFGWLFTVKRGYVDGWRGAYVAWWSALYPLVVHLKALRGPKGSSR